MLYHDIKYSKIIGSRIDGYKVKKDSPFLAVCRCKVCGDSKKKRKVGRFYFYTVDQSVLVKCHNCGYSTNIYGFMKDFFPQEFGQYVLEVFSNTKEEKPQDDWIPEKIHLDRIDLPLVSSLDDGHPAKEYIKSRMLPKYRFMWADRFFEFASAHNTAFENQPKDHGRIVIPFYDRSGKMIAYQARTLGDELPKYYTIVFKQPKVFGLDRVDPKRTIYIVEGPLDALLIDNCLAATSSALVQCAGLAAKELTLNHKEGFVLVYDNEPRNKEIVALQRKAIEQGHKVVVWPDSYKYKDVNDAVMAGMPKEEIMEMIKENTYSGLIAKLKFSNWVKVNEETCRTRIRT